MLKLHYDPSKSLQQFIETNEDVLMQHYIKLENLSSHEVDNIEDNEDYKTWLSGYSKQEMMLLYEDFLDSNS